MAVLSGEERIIRTLKREVVDRVPTFEWYIDREVIEALSPGSNYEKYCKATSDVLMGKQYG